MRLIPAYIFVFISFCLFFASCEKENTTFPSISEIKLNQGGSYEFGDTIIVQTNILDVDGSVRLAILEGASARPLPYEVFSIRGNEYTYRIFVNDKYYESGIYDLRIQAFNGVNGVSSFQKIRIQGLEKAIRGIAYLQESGTNTVLFKIDSLGIQTQSLLSNSYKKIVADSRNAQLLSLPKSTGSLKSNQFNTLNGFWDLVLSPSNLIYQNLYRDNNESFLIVDDGRVFSVTSDGQALLKFSLPDNFIAQNMAFGENHMLISAKKQGVELYELFLLQKVTNSIIQRAFVSNKPVKMKYIGNGIYWLAYSKTNNVKLAEYNVNSGLLTEKYTIENEIAQSLEVASGIIYVGTDQNIYTIPGNAFQFPQLLFSFGAEDLVFDEVNGEIYIVNGTNIWKSVIGSNQNQFFASGAEPFLSLDILYNK